MFRSVAPRHRHRARPRAEGPRTRLDTGDDQRTSDGSALTDPSPGNKPAQTDRTGLLPVGSGCFSSSSLLRSTGAPSVITPTGRRFGPARPGPAGAARPPVARCPIGAAVGVGVGVGVRSSSAPRLLSEPTPHPPGVCARTCVRGGRCSLSTQTGTRSDTRTRTVAYIPVKGGGQRHRATGTGSCRITERKESMKLI